jgi:hypothetical protein
VVVRVNWVGGREEEKGIEREENGFYGKWSRGIARWLRV